MKKAEYGPVVTGLFNRVYEKYIRIVAGVWLIEFSWWNLFFWEVLRGSLAVERLRVAGQSLFPGAGAEKQVSSAPDTDTAATLL